MSPLDKHLKNPYLPSWEYIPDGEPHVFDGRVYVYGSHDLFNGWVYCLGDYVCWSAPEEDLSDWRYEGVIYRKTQDPDNREGDQCLYAPDVTRGPDGRYYLYYVLDHQDIVSVAVCDTPAGQYEFYGHVHYPDGTLLGMKPGDDPQFDPAVLTEGEDTWLYTGGVCFRFEKKKGGAMGMRLERDMLTVAEGPVFVVPSAKTSRGTGFEDHEFFEASSIRKFGDLYYFVYSSVWMNELCYAVSSAPLGPYAYRGVLVSNCDWGIGGWKSPEKKTTVGGNNHGGLVEVLGQRYIFYHRHTNGTEFSRQGCLQKLTVLPDGTMPQAEMTSDGGGEPFEGRGNSRLISPATSSGKPCSRTGRPRAGPASPRTAGTGTGKTPMRPTSSTASPWASSISTAGASAASLQSPGAMPGAALKSAPPWIRSLWAASPWASATSGPPFPQTSRSPTASTLCISPTAGRAAPCSGPSSWNKEALRWS